MKTVEYEVVVAGGGIAGVAAALAAARLGRRTALIEKTILPGGLATTGLIYIYLPLCDGCGTQVTFGIAEELFGKSMFYGPGRVDPAWASRTEKSHDSQRLRCFFSPDSFMLALDEALDEAGVDVWFDTLAVAVNRSGARVDSIEVENKSGRIRIQAACFVDCTGDADLVRRAGGVVHDSLNALTLWSLEYNTMRRGDEAPDVNSLAPELRMQTSGAPPSDRTEETGNIPADRLYRGIDGRSVSDFVRRGRRELRERYKELYESKRSTRNEVFALKLPGMAQFRRTFCIDGDYMLAPGECGKHFDDSIGMTADWRRSGEVWELPYRSLLPRDFENLWAAGRCSSAAGDAWEVTRVIPSAAVTGEGAGVAAALCSQRQCASRALPPELLQRTLRANNVKLHFAEVGL